MSSRQEWIEFILDHYENPRNRGPLSPADIVMKGGNPACGDIVTLYLQIDPATHKIERVQFTGEGCTISQAAASLTTTKVQGHTVAEARALRASDLLEALGATPVQSRRRCATLALHTLRAALTQYLERSGQGPAPGEQDEDEAGLQFEPQLGRER